MTDKRRAVALAGSILADMGIEPLPGKRRDLTEAQFGAACKQRGFKREMFGYYALGETGISACVDNAGRNRRAQLAYLVREHAKATERTIFALPGAVLGEKPIRA